MSNQKIGKELDLILLLTENKRWRVTDLAERMDMSPRLLYYYFEFLRNYGFNVIKERNTYTLDPRSPFFSVVRERMILNKAEAEYIYKVLTSRKRTSQDPAAVTAQMKLERYFNLDPSMDSIEVKRLNENLMRIEEAMKQRCVVLLKNYSSGNSRTVTDRMVEPFLLMNDNRDVRCYEINSHMNKTFKLSRMESVEIMQVPWFNEDKHKELYTDIFMFSGEELHTVELILGQLSHNLILEEYPRSEQFLSRIDDKHWCLKTDVASYLGIGRFVMGLYEDIEVIGDAGFKQYIKEKVLAMKVGEATS